MRQMLLRRTAVFYFLISVLNFGQSQDAPNIMIIVADDMGQDVFSRYEIGEDLPNTPFLDSLSHEGLLFSNAYAKPLCAPSRAALLTGMYGNKNGVTELGINLPNNRNTIFENITEETNGEYATALFGKWHLGGANSPNNQGVQHFDGVFGGAVQDYFQWNRTINGVTESTDEYMTSYLTDAAINWVDEQDQPWFLWMAYTAPHSPFHVPPDGLYTRADTTSNLDKFLCMIESLDHETARLYHSLSQQEKENTMVIFVGDNGTPNTLLQGFPAQHGKGSLYEGGINVPMFMSGYGVERIDEIENALVGFTDLFATISELMGADLPGGIFNSYSFLDLLSDPNAASQRYNYSELGNDAIDRAIRNDRYKLITRADGVQEFYDLVLDPFEIEDLVVAGLSDDEMLYIDELQMESDSIFYSWSCRDGILNGNEEGIDCGGTSCSPCTSSLNLISAEHDILIFPVPASDELHVEMDFGNYAIKILSLSANVHSRFMFEGSQLKIDISDLLPGLYLIELTDSLSQEIITKNFIKN